MFAAGWPGADRKSRAAHGEHRNPFSVVFGSSPRPRREPTPVQRLGVLFGAEPEPPEPPTALQRLGTLFGGGETHETPEEAPAPARGGPSCGAALAQRAAAVLAAARKCCEKRRRGSVFEECRGLFSADLDVLTEAGSAAFARRYPLPEETVVRHFDASDRLRMKRLFALFGAGESERISKRDVSETLRGLGNPPSADEAGRMISQLDTAKHGPKDGAIDFEEFCVGLVHRRCLLYQALYNRHQLSGDDLDGDETKLPPSPAAPTAAPFAAPGPRQKLSVVLDKATKRRTLV
ncbi:hypothetical protein M885DRAFT_557527 [Pelagophyceae sp. CCMP2097]|nr:hypothetical protein M885DRAFT_557527 [Pelagophyceae sp. CCMP2097]